MKRLLNLDTVNISGKPYVMVDKRIAHCASNFDYDVKIKKVEYYSEIKTWTVHVKLKIDWQDKYPEWTTFIGFAQDHYRLSNDQVDQLAKLWTIKKVS